MTQKVYLIIKISISFFAVCNVYIVINFLKAIEFFEDSKQY